MNISIRNNDEFIRLGQALKKAGIVGLKYLFSLGHCRHREYLCLCQNPVLKSYNYENFVALMF